MPRQKTVTDDVVMAAALDVLAAEGPHGFTLAVVGRRAGLAAATLVQRHGSKRGLMLAALRAGNAAVGREVEGLGDERSAAALVRWLAGLAGGFGDRSQLANGLALLGEDLRDPDLAIIAAERMALIRQAIGRLLPATRLTQAEAVRLVEAQWHGSVIQAALGGEDDIPAAVARSIGALLEALGADTDRASE